VSDLQMPTERRMLGPANSVASTILILHELLDSYKIESLLRQIKVSIVYSLINKPIRCYMESLNATLI